MSTEKSKVLVQWTEKTEARKVLEDILEKMRHKRSIKTARGKMASLYGSYRFEMGRT